LKAFFPATLELAFCSLLLALVIGVPLGILSAVYRNRWLDHLVRLMAMTGISTPAFWLGLGVIVLFYGHLQSCRAAAGWTTGSIRRRTSPAFICWTRCWKATARSFSTRCST
jgi:ABC-type dipeptide/oligopeptide/nickel transport system permease component